ncbi:MAG TPA: hypothetical protein PK616_03120 [Fibrobacteraceae bacterium]|nr:hypothetical protein [Fibrobacteraceae bacterium]
MKSTIEKLKDLFTNRSKYFELDKRGIDLARNVLSGNGWTEDDKKFFGEFKQNINIPLLSSWINEVKATYTNDPFAIGLTCDVKDISNIKRLFENVLKENNIEDLMAESLEEILGTGLDYVLVTPKIVDPNYNLQTIELRRIDARKVIVDYGESRTMDDVQNALIVDIESHNKVISDYGLEERVVRMLAKSKHSFSDLDIDYDSSYQILVGTMYEMVEGGCKISKIIGDEVVKESKLIVSRIPLVRFTGLAVQLDGVKHFRGVYNRVADLWKMINYSLSEVQYRIATAPSEDYIGDPRGFLPYQDYFNRDNGSKIKPYQKFDADGNDLGDLKEVNRTPQISAYMDAVNVLRVIVSDSLGSTNANPLPNETAESVLTRKNTKQATVNEFMHLLQVSIKAVGELILELLPTVYDVPIIDAMGNLVREAVTDIVDIDVEVSDGPVQASLRLNQMQQAVAMFQMATAAQVPGAYQKFLPMIIELSELDVNYKQYLLQQLAGELPVEAQQQLQQKDQIIAQANQQIEALQKNVAALQTELNEFVDDSEIKLRIAQMDNETKIFLKRMELAASNEELLAKLQADFMSQQAKLQMELAKKRLDLASKVPEVPVFSAQRTFV